MGKSKTISLISIFYILGATLILISSINDNITISGYAVSYVIGLSFLSDLQSKLLFSIGTLVIIFGLANFKKWGFYSFIIYNVYILLINYLHYKETNNQLFCGNLIWSIFVIILILFKRKMFYSK